LIWGGKSLAKTWPAPSLGVGKLARFNIEKDTKVYARTDDVAEKSLGARTSHW